MTKAAAQLDQFSSLRLGKARAGAAIALGSVLATVSLALSPDERGFWGVLLAFGLSWASMIDIDRFTLPDGITLGLVVAGLGIQVFRGVPLTDFLIGAVGGYLVLALVAKTYENVRGRPGLGLGDAKLLSAAGAWLGWAALPLVVLSASLAALMFACLLMAKRAKMTLTTPVPFGPFIASAFFVSWVCGI